MNSTERSQLLQSLDDRCDAIADNWRQAIASTSFVPLNAAEVRQCLLELTEQAVALLLTEPFDQRGSQAIGTTLARLGYIQSEALGRTQEVLACQLVEDLPADQVVALQPRLAALLGGLAAGFLQQARETILTEQEQIRMAFITERKRAEEELKRYRDHLEQLVEERTAKLTKANEQLQREITERVRAEEEIQWRAAQLEGLREVGLELIAQLDLDPLLHSIVFRAVELLGGTRGGLWLHRPERRVLEKITAVGSTTIARIGSTLRQDEGLSGKVWKRGEPLVVDDYQRWEGRLAASEELPRGGLVGVPVRWGEEFLGVLVVGDDAPRAFSAADTEMLSLFATQAAIAIRNARLYDQAQQEIAERKRAEEALRKAHDELEIRVQERTAELSKANVLLEREIAERKRAEDVLRQSEERYRAVVESQTELIDRWLPDGTITFVNEAYCRYYGKPREELIGHKWMMLVAEQDQERIKAYVEHLATSLSPANPMMMDEYREVVADGRIRWQQWIDQAIFDEQGHLVEFQSVGRDITERKRAEEALERRGAQLALINDIGRKIVAALDLDEVLDRATRLLQESFDYHHVALFIVDLEREEAVLRAVAGSYAAYLAEDRCLRLTEGMIGWTASHGVTRLANDVSTDPHYIERFSDAMTQAKLCVPIQVGGETIGVLDVQSPQLDAFAKSDVLLMETLADQIAVAIKNARLYQAEQKRATQLAVVNQVARRAVSILDRDQLLQETVTAIQQGFNYHNVALSLLDEAAGELEVLAIAGGFADLIPSGYRQAVGIGMIGWTAETGQPLLANNVRLGAPHSGFLKEPLAKAVLCVPLKLADRVIGVLDVQDTQLNAFDETDLLATKTLADQIAIAIENARLFKETKRRFEEIMALYQTSLDISAQLEMSELLKSIVKRAVTLLRAETGGICLYDPEREELRVAIGYGLAEEYVGTTVKPGEGMAGKVFQTGEPLIVDDYRTWEGRAQLYEADQPFTAVLEVPMKWQERVIGVLAIDADVQKRTFNQDDVWLATLFANQAAIAIENARLYQQTDEKLQIRVKELSALYTIAEMVNHSLDLDAVLQLALGSAIRLMGMDSGGILLLDPSADELSLRAHRGGSPEFIRAVSRIKVDEGLMPRMLKSVLVVEDLSKVTKARRVAIEREGLQCLVSIPLKAQESLVGIMVMGSHSPRTLAPEERELLAAIGNQVGVAVDRANLQAQEVRAAILEERQHMAQQMHDDIAQTLGYLGLQVDRVMGGSSLAQNVEVQAELEEIRKSIEDTYERVRSSIMRLREDVPGHFDLGAALPEIISEFEKQTGCRVESRVDEDQLPRLPPSVAFQVTHIIREALSNVRKHSGADSVHLTLQGLEDGRVEVTIQDNGLGFDLDSDQQPGWGGFGLRFMRERAERVGGSLRIESEPGQGTRVVVSLPPG